MTARVRVYIDRIVTDDPGLSRQALVEALTGVFAGHIADHGVESFGRTRNEARARGHVTAGEGALAQRVAQATLGAVKL